MTEPVEAHGMPPLPETEFGLAFWDEGGIHEATGDGYSADQMLAYAQAYGDARAAAERERCAKVCDEAKPRGGRMWTDEQAACFDCLTHVAAAIRATTQEGEKP